MKGSVGSNAPSGASNWIPRGRIRLALAVAAALALLGLIGAGWHPATLILLVPAMGAAWTAFILLRIRRQLSSGGGGWERRIHETVVAQLNLSPDARAKVLDIGCGDASLLLSILDRAPMIQATGVDLWGEDWSYAQAACESRLASLGYQAAFKRMDASRLDFPDETFDIVVSVMCFHEVRAAQGPDQVSGPQRAVGEALRVLRPGGRFVLVDRFESQPMNVDNLNALLQGAGEHRRQPLASVLSLPWPLSNTRALGRAELICGQRAS